MILGQFNSGAIDEIVTHLHLCHTGVTLVSNDKLSISRHCWVAQLVTIDFQMITGRFFIPVCSLSIRVHTWNYISTRVQPLWYVNISLKQRSKRIDEGSTISYQTTRCCEGDLTSFHLFAKGSLLISMFIDFIRCVTYIEISFCAFYRPHAHSMSSLISAIQSVQRHVPIEERRSDFTLTARDGTFARFRVCRITWHVNQQS